MDFYLENEISYLVQGYECGMRTDVAYANKCLVDLQKLVEKYPQHKELIEKKLGRKI